MPEVDVLTTANAALERLVPRAYGMGVRFVELRPGYVCSEVPAEGNGNHFGVMYAGVTFTLAEVLGGAMHIVTFDATTHYPLVRRMEIDFLASGRGPLRAVATLPAEEVARIRAAAARDAKVSFELMAEVTGADGALVARTRADYQLRPFGR